MRIIIILLNILLVLLALIFNTASAANNDEVSAFGYTYKLPAKNVDYRFDIMYQKDEHQGYFQVDSSQPEGQRVSVKNSATQTLAIVIKELIDTLEKEPLEELWCTDFLRLIGDDLTLQQATEHEQTYSFTPQPGEYDDEDDKKFLSNMFAQITIEKNTGKILRFQMRNTQPFNPVFFAKIERVHLLADCKALRNENGSTQMYVAKFRTSIVGKLAFKHFEENELRLVTQLTKID